MILFTADWHIKLGQKNVPLPWACTRYKLFFEALMDLEPHFEMHIIGGDLFDRTPSMIVATAVIFLMTPTSFFNTKLWFPIPFFNRY